MTTTHYQGLSITLRCGVCGESLSATAHVDDCGFREGGPPAGPSIRFEVDPCDCQGLQDVPDDEPVVEDVDEAALAALLEHGGTCPHGEAYHECETCLRLGDEAFDAARERAFLGR